MITDLDAWRGRWRETRSERGGADGVPRPANSRNRPARGGGGATERRDNLKPLGRWAKDLLNGAKAPWRKRSAVLKKPLKPKSTGLRALTATS